MSSCTSLLPLLLIIAIGYFFISSFRKAKAKYENIPSFLEYKEADSELIKNGKVTCKHCGGNNIFVKEIGKTPKSFLNVHICKTCGETLYRSQV